MLSHNSHLTTYRHLLKKAETLCLSRQQPNFWRSLITHHRHTITELRLNP